MQGHTSAKDRYKSAAAVLRVRDVEDKQEYRKRRRQHCEDIKEKCGGTKGDEPRVAILGPGLGFPGEEGPEKPGMQLQLNCSITLANGLENYPGRKYVIRWHFSVCCL